MPIRRSGGGEIVQEPTRLQPPVRRGKSGDAAKRPPPPPGSPPEDASLLGPKPPPPPPPRESPPPAGGPMGGPGMDRLEAPTVLVRGAKRTDDSRTRLVRQPAGDAGAAPAAAGKDEPLRDLPVGWLVVVRGPGRGRVVTLGTGMNTIGRGSQSRARIDFGDDLIARADHARVVYEPRTRRYLLSHGAGSNLTYLHGEVVITPVEIEAGAMIEVGETTLRFQPFCSRDFDWPDAAD